jgi:hypothetical protein
VIGTCGEHREVEHRLLTVVSDTSPSTNCGPSR